MVNNSKFNQFKAAFTASMSVITAGSCVSWINYEEDSKKVHQKEIIGHFSFDFIMFFCETFVAAFFSFFLIRWRGPLAALRLGAWLTLLVWIITVWLMHFQDPFRTMIHLFALVCGFTAAPICLYIGEIAQKEVRGAFATLIYLNFKIGIFIADLAFQLHTHFAVCYTCISICCLQIIFLFQIYEAPLFLVLNRENEKAKEVLYWLHDEEFDTKTEYNYIENIATSIKEDSLVTTLRKCFKSRRVWIVVLGVIFFEQLSGITSAYQVSDYVFETALENVKPYVCGVASGASQILAIVLSMLLIDKSGRRPILLTSSVGISLASFLLGICLSSKYLNWFTIATVLLYLTAFAFGYGPMMCVAITELFPTDCKILGCPLAIAMHWLLKIFATTLTQFFIYEKIVETDPRFGYVFFLFGALSFLCLAFVLFLIPETKQKTYSEIEEILK